MILPSFFLSIYKLTNNTYYDILSTKKEVKNSWQRIHQREMGFGMDQYANAPLPEVRRRVPIMA
jgi:hypothetical protein